MSCSVDEAAYTLKPRRPSYRPRWPVVAFVAAAVLAVVAVAAVATKDRA
jgi:hypothetical protein